ncbi:cytochrome c maturation protein CcmE [Sandaracinobacteroides saxicola]|uniref:Cytochrome c-type biogenesis protein CcmE n=1 Tax=Sandaracinobacteroides saxicola TaxID=2759707 RepID=A0A7G5IL95_9SPHN|nr:cytochrome c maturation protein CcmE [Sandaracinobacteroides saxicola]QMW24137.1 cytochrome c maturation protein CcmE [Sandaracinobacteroides saxicola]
MKAKQQRLVLALAALGALAGAGILATSALGDTATYFYAPSDVAKAPPETGKTIRLGGLVKPGSVSRSADGLTLAFTVTDRAFDTRVQYRGIVPDLFREDQGVIATGRFESGTFRAEQILAKHDENYMPPEVAGALHKVQGKVE